MRCRRRGAAGQGLRRALPLTVAPYPIAAFTVSGSPSGDKLNTLTSLAIFAAQHGMLWIGTGQNPGNNDDESAATDAENRLGSFIGAMAQAANDSPDVTPKAGDRATARSLGRRVALAATRWRAGATAETIPA